MCRRLSASTLGSDLSSSGRRPVITSAVSSTPSRDTDRDRASRSGTVYVLRSGQEDLFKIGRTGSAVEARIRSLSTGNPHPLTLFDSIETEDDAACEAFIHGQLQGRRSTDSHAREFFAVSATELESVISRARTFLSYDLPRAKEVEILARADCDGQIISAKEGHVHLYRQLLVAREYEYRARAKRLRLENDLKLAIGTAAEVEGLATWKAHAKVVFDEARFKTAEPSLHRRFLRETSVRTLRLL
jgi:hypothetical protein